MTPVVALHGFTGHGGHWQPVLDQLRTVGAVWCPALLGHGEEAGRVGVERFDDEVERLVAGLDQRFSARVLLVGYSLGARVALRLLVRYPRRIWGAVLIGGRAGLGTAAARAARVAADAKWVNLLEREGIGAFVDRWQELALFASQRRLPETVQAGQRRHRLGLSPQGLARSLRVLGLGAMPDCWPLLETIACPVHLMAGADDTAFVEEAYAMATSIPNSRVELVPSAGHNLILETPGAVAAAIDKERVQCLS